MKRFKQIKKFANGKILDIGFADFPNSTINGLIGIDLKTTLKPSNYYSVSRADALKIPFKKESFDTVIASELIEHLENASEFLRQCHSILKTGGHLLLSTPNPFYPPVIFFNLLMIKKFYFNDTHLNLFPPRIMFKLLKKNGFHLEKILPGSGIVFPTKSVFIIPFFKMLNQHLVYICKKI